MRRWRLVKERRGREERGEFGRWCSPRNHEGHQGAPRKTRSGRPPCLTIILSPISSVFLFCALRAFARDDLIFPNFPIVQTSRLIPVISKIEAPIITLISGTRSTRSAGGGTLAEARRAQERKTEEIGEDRGFDSDGLFAPGRAVSRVGRTTARGSAFVPTLASLVTLW